MMSRSKHVPSTAVVVDTTVTVYILDGHLPSGVMANPFARKG